MKLQRRCRFIVGVLVGGFVAFKGYMKLQRRCRFIVGVLVGGFVAFKGYMKLQRRCRFIVHTADSSALIRINLRNYRSPSVGARTSGTLSDGDGAAGG
jgi:hypothetical protein